MKHNIKKFLLPLLAAASVTFAACSDWTESESLGIDYPTLEEQNPELYKQYLAALRAYKKSDHKVVIYIMPGSAATPAQRNEHITNAPDSVDFICLKNPAGLNPVLVNEMQQVHEKGTRVIYNIDYAAIEKRWKEILDQEAAQPDPTEEGGEGQPEDPRPTDEERFLAFCKEQTALQVAYFDQYNFDGIEISYMGRNVDGMTDAEKTAYTARQDAFLSVIKTWYGAGDGKLLFFQGNPQNLIDKTLLAECAYITLDTFSAVSGDELSYKAMMASVPGVPADRFIAGVKTPSLVDPTLPDGYFTGFESDGKTKLHAAKGAAAWVVLPGAKYTKAGIAVSDAQNDYFNTKLIYKNIREAIRMMNPAPKN